MIADLIRAHALPYDTGPVSSSSLYPSFTALSTSTFPGTSHWITMDACHDERRDRRSSIDGLIPSSTWHRDWHLAVSAHHNWLIRTALTHGPYCRYAHGRPLFKRACVYPALLSDGLHHSRLCWVAFCNDCRGTFLQFTLACRSVCVYYTVALQLPDVVSFDVVCFFYGLI